MRILIASIVFLTTVTASITSAIADPISLLNTRVTNVSNIKQVAFEATFKDEVLGNGFCFITTGSFERSLKDLLPAEQVSRLGNIFEQKKVRTFSKYDAYCGLTTGSKVKSSGLLGGRVAKNVRARIFLATYQNGEAIDIVRDASACTFVRFARSCFKTKRANVETIENNDGTVSVKGAVTGIAGCFEVYERRGDLKKSVVVSLGNVPAAIASQSNSKVKNAIQEDKTCNDRGFSS